MYKEGILSYHSLGKNGHNTSTSAKYLAILKYKSGNQMQFRGSVFQTFLTMEHF
jgi:hypothetical protein